MPEQILVDSSVILAYSCRQDKNMSLSYGDIGGSLNNRRDFLLRLGIDHRSITCAKQIHSCRVKYVKELDRGRGALNYESSIADTDAFITDKRNLALAIFSADCLPIFLFDPVKPTIGLVHAGWKSTRENISAKTIKLMQKYFGTQPGDLRVTFGPAIQECCYQVQDDFCDIFPGYVRKNKGSFYLDLAGVNKSQLLELGVKEENISDAKICTSCRSQDFFSFRKEGPSCGRMISVIMLK